MNATILAGILAAGLAQISGTLTGPHGEPLDMAYIAAYDLGWQSRGDARTDASGAFNVAAGPAQGYLQVQPARAPGVGGMLTYAWQPRVYVLSAQDTQLALKVPPAVNYIIAAYSEDGKLMQWKDWERQGKYGARFLYATDGRLRALPSTNYPVFGRYAGSEDDGRGAGLPAVLVEPGQAIEIHALFWKCIYGKLQLSVPVPPLKSAGDALLINWNHALAQATIDAARAAAKAHEALDIVGALAALDTLAASLTPPAGELATPEEAAAADAVLAQALEIADQSAVERARQRARAVRYGALQAEMAKALVLKRPAFEFGVYQGSPFHASGGKPYAAAPAYSFVRDAGFSLATVLPAWGWAGPYTEMPEAMEQTFGVAALRAMGYRVKAHGVCWLQTFMDILPPEKKSLSHEQLAQAALNYQKALLDLWGDQIDLWEAINEPATTNAVGFSRESMAALMRAAAKNIADKGHTTLVNSPHEFNYGTKHDFYLPSGQPLDPYPDTFALFLDAAGLENIDVIGLQVYPGFHLRGGEPGKPFEGPAWTPAFFERMLDTYAQFRKVIHITEFSLPSTYGDDWKAGYWRQPWDDVTQADYAEAIYTIAFGHPNVQSITWWDITDEKPSVESGGLLKADRTPKPVFDRLTAFIEAAQSPEDVDGLYLPGGLYTNPAGEQVVVLPGGKISP